MKPLLLFIAPLLLALYGGVMYPDLGWAISFMIIAVMVQVIYSLSLSSFIRKAVLEVEGERFDASRKIDLNTPMIKKLRDEKNDLMKANRGLIQQFSDVSKDYHEAKTRLLMEIEELKLTIEELRNGQPTPSPRTEEEQQAEAEKFLGIKNNAPAADVTGRSYSAPGQHFGVAELMQRRIPKVTKWFNPRKPDVVTATQYLRQNPHAAVPQVVRETGVPTQAVYIAKQGLRLEAARRGSV